MTTQGIDYKQAVDLPDALRAGGRLASIDVMRAVASMLVVAFHLTPEADITGPFSAGIDIFFFITGFLMVHITDRRKPGFWTFMRARAIRVVPLYWLATLTLILVWWLRSEPLPHLDDVVLSLLFIFHANSHSGISLPVLGAGWTTNYLMFFYLLFGITLSLGRAAQLAVLSGILISLAALRPFVDEGNAFATRMTSPILLEFLLGSFAAAALRRFRQREFLSVLHSPLACFSIMVSAIVLQILASQYLIGMPRVVIVGLPAAIFLIGAMGLEAVFASRPCAVMRLLGNASFSLYLFHLHVILLFGSIAADLAEDLFRVLAFATAVLVSLLIYLGIEKPAGSGLRILSRRCWGQATA